MYYLSPIMGPNRNPRLKATPMSAMPFPLVAGVVTSVTMAVDKLTLPLLTPPMILASTKMAKLLESTQSRYEKAIPRPVATIRGLRPNLHEEIFL